MQTVLLVVSIFAIAVVAGAFVVLVSGILREARKLGRAAEDISRLVASCETEVSNTARDARAALEDVDLLVSNVNATVRRVDRLTGSIEHIVDGAQVADAATKALKSSTAGLASVYEGVKQGIRTLYGPQEK